MFKFNYSLITVKDQAVEGHTDIVLIFKKKRKKRNNNKTKKCENNISHEINRLVNTGSWNQSVSLTSTISRH